MIQGAVRVSQGIVVEAEETPQSVTLAPESHSEETMVTSSHARVEDSEVEEVSEQSLEVEQSNVSVSEEVEGDRQGGSDDTGEVVELSVKTL